MSRDSGCAWVASGAAFRLGMQRVSAQHTEATICSVLPQQVQHGAGHRGAGVLRAEVVQGVTEQAPQSARLSTGAAIVHPSYLFLIGGEYRGNRQISGHRR